MSWSKPLPLGRPLSAILALGLAILPSSVVGDAGPLMRVYLFRPAVFADTHLGPRIPAPSSINGTAVWYIRMDDPARSRYGTKRLVRFIRANGVPGLDFSGHKTLTTEDIEKIFGTLHWLQLDSSAKFRLLKLSGTQIDDRALMTLSRLFDLQVLELSDRVTDEGIPFLESLKQLKVLSLSGSAISDESANTLGQLQHLERLDIQTTAITDEGLKKLQKLRLRELDLGPQITDAGLRAIASMATLEQLDLHRTQITGQGLVALAKLSQIHTLFLGASITDADMPALLAFPNLQRLDLTGTRLSDASLATLTRIASLQELALTQTTISDQGWKALGALPKLRYLEMSQTAATFDVLKAMQGFESLQVLSFSHGQRLSARDIKPLARWLRLHTVIINGYPMGRELMKFLRHWEEVHNWLMEQLVPSAHALTISEKEVDKALQLAEQASDPRLPRRQGLQMIHQAESDLNEIIEAPATSEGHR